MITHKIKMKACESRLYILVVTILIVSTCRDYPKFLHEREVSPDSTTSPRGLDAGETASGNSYVAFILNTVFGFDN
jgi:hypothetical protein